MNPAREVKTERFSRIEGKTPAFVEGEVQKLLGVIETSTHTGLRDRALLGVLAYTFARIGAVVNLKVEDYYPSGKRFLLRFKEKGGKEKELPVHHKLEELRDEYLKVTGLGSEPGSVLIPGRREKDREVIAPAACAHGGSGANC
jgi:site-specific recombinase XerD